MKLNDKKFFKLSRYSNELAKGDKMKDKFDLLSAIWVMSCNDDNPIMFYKSVKDRLQLDSVDEVKNLVEKRSELFRRESTTGLNEWKEKKKKETDSNKLPNWIKKEAKSKNNEVDMSKVNGIVDKVSAEDIFRSQFRTTIGAPQSSIEVIDWGLKHIDRLRSAEYQQVDRTFKTWQLWSVIVLGVLNIVVTLYTRK